MLERRLDGFDARRKIPAGHQPSSYKALKEGSPVVRVVVTPNVVVRCWRYRTRVASGMIRYRGVRRRCTFIAFRVFSGDGTWRVRIRGRGINVSRVVRGSLALNGANTRPTGTYSIAGREFRPWPRRLHRYSLAR